MTEKGICKFCEQPKELINSHIIPKKFYLDYEKDNGYRSIDLDGNWEKCYNGQKDYLLCHECDAGLFKKLDDYGYKIFLNEYANHIEQQDKDFVLYHLNKNDFDYYLLRKFFISVLWRASISKIKGFLNVDLGVYENIAKDILNDKTIHPELFNFFIFKFPDGKDLNKTVYIKRLKFYNSTLYNIVMAGFDILIIVKNNMPYAIKEIYNHYIATENDLYIFESEGVYKDHEQKLLKIANRWKKS